MLSTVCKIGPQARRVGLRALSASASNAQHQDSAGGSSYTGKASSLIALAGVFGLATGALGVAQLEPAPRKPPTSSEAIPLTQTTDPTKPNFNRPPHRPDLPTYSLEEVAEHCDEESLWYTFRGAVYDLVRFKSASWLRFQNLPVSQSSDDSQTHVIGWVHSCRRIRPTFNRVIPEDILVCSWLLVKIWSRTGRFIGSTFAATCWNGSKRIALAI